MDRGFFGRQARRAGNAISTAGRATGATFANAGGAIADGYEWASGASAARDATNKQVKAGEQGMTALQGGAKDAQGYLEDYNNPQDQQTLRNMVNGGSFKPQYTDFLGNTGYTGMKAPEAHQYQDKIGYQAQDYNNPGMSTTDNLSGYSLKGFDPTMPTAPVRQAATAENVNMYQDPGYQFRLGQGLQAAQNSAAGGGGLHSGRALKALNDYAQGQASQEFGASYNRFQDAQNNAQGDFRDTRNFASSQLNDSRNAFNQDRNFGRDVFTQDRAYGTGQDNFNRQFAQGNAQDVRDFNQNAFQYQNNFNADNAQNTFSNAYKITQDRNAWNANQAGDRYNQFKDLASGSQAAASAQAGYAYQSGQDQAGLLTDIGNTRAAGITARSSANRALVGDLFDGGMRLADLAKKKGK